MENIENMPRPEIILVADTVAREKNIDKEDVFVAMEVAIQKAARSKYGFEHDIRAVIDRKTGAINLSRYREIVDELPEEDEESQASKILLKDAKAYKKDAKVGEFIIDTLPPIDFGRIAAQTAKQVIMQKFVMLSAINNLKNIRKKSEQSLTVPLKELNSVMLF